MPNNRHEDSQMTLNFERDTTSLVASAVQANTRPAMSRPNLHLVIDNSPFLKLAPNSAEITRMLADQAMVLRW